MRSRSIGQLAVGTAAVLALSGCWLQPGFVPGRTNYNAGEQLLTAATVGDLTELWSTSIASPGVTQAIVHEPLALNDAIYVAATQFLGPGAAARLDAATGAVVWNSPLEAPITGQVSVDDPAYLGSVRIPVEASGIGGGVFSVNPETGAVTSAGSVRIVDGDLAVVDDQLVMRRAQFIGPPSPVVITEVTMPDFRPAVASQGTSIGSVESDYAVVGDSVAWATGATTRSASALAATRRRPSPRPMSTRAGRSTSAPGRGTRRRSALTRSSTPTTRGPSR